MRFRTVPGWQNSGPEHWQSTWERLDARITRVQQDDWDQPELDAWSSRLEASLTEASVLIAHSLGCLISVRARKNVAAALLVAPPDVERIVALRPFTPPMERLPFPSTLVFSSDDPWCTAERSRRLGDAWGSTVVDVGARGHLNTESRLGTWPEGRELLRRLCTRLPFALDARLEADTLPVVETERLLLRMLNDARYPWFVLIPRRSAITEVFQLDDADRRALHEASTWLSRVMSDAFRADKLNVGALGNVVPQLHVHHVVRHLGDPAWPGPVWGHSPRVPMRADEAAARVATLQGATDFEPLLRAMG